MPLLDVTEVLTDPDFVDFITVNRRAETVNNFGESVITPTAIPNVAAVICQTTPDDLRRLAEYDLGNRTLSIVTKFRLQLPSPGFKADTVTWEGNEYIVITLDPYTRYGIGFVEAFATSMDYTDQPPV